MCRGMRITDGFQWAALKVPEKLWPKSTGHLVAPCAWPFLEMYSEFRNGFDAENRDTIIIYPG